MKVLGQLEEASLENRAADPAAPQEGRLWLNKTTNKFKAYINGAVVNVLTAVDLITTAMIGDGQVARAKIADAAINAGKIEDGAIVTAKIGDSQVTTGKIANGAITNSKLSAPKFTIVNVVSHSISSGTVPAPQPIAGVDCSGRPVEISFIPNSVDSSYVGVQSASNHSRGIVTFYRNAAIIGTAQFSITIPAGSSTSTIEIPVSSFKFIDATPPVGINNYTFAIGWQGPGTTYITNCKFYAREW